MGITGISLFCASPTLQVPISLFVTLEIVKYAQARAIISADPRLSGYPGKTLTLSLSLSLIYRLLLRLRQVSSAQHAQHGGNGQTRGRSNSRSSVGAGVGVRAGARAGAMVKASRAGTGQ